MDRRRPLLVNEGEFKTDEALREAAAALGYGVHAKVRVADALSIDRSGLTDDQYGYALRSHFDWLVTDLETTVPEFAVEFDGESHDDARVKHRDGLKDAICERLGLPVLRVDRSGLRPTIRRTVIWYLVESWSIWCAFTNAQDDGIIPVDEIFEPWMVIDAVDERGNIRWRDMAAPTRVFAQRLWESGALMDPGPSSVHRVGHQDDPDHAEAYAWVNTTDGHVVVGHARIRAYSFPAVLDFDLAEDLAHLELGGRLARWTEGDASVLQDPGALPTFGMDWGGATFVRGPMDLPAA
jgi:hypothetical protein